MGFELRFFWRDLNHGLEMAWGDPSHPFLGFLMDGSRGAYRAKGGSFLHLFTKRGWERSKGIRMEAMDEGSLGASFHGGLMEA